MGKDTVDRRRCDISRLYGAKKGKYNNLYNYINDFLKKTNFNYFIGIKYFYNIKNKDLDYIESNEFYESLLNIFPNTIYQSLLNDDNQFNVKSFVRMLGEKYLILCLETIKYNKYGLNSYELSNSLSSFFPNISKNLIKNFIMSIDKPKKGNISYLQLFHFMYNFTKEKFSYNRNNCSANNTFTYYIFKYSKER